MKFFHVWKARLGEPEFVPIVASERLPVQPRNASLEAVYA